MRRDISVSAAAARLRPRPSILTLVRRPTGWVAAGCLAISAGAAAQSPPPAIDAYIAKAMKDWDVPGLSISIVQGGRVVAAKGYGVRGLGRPDAVDENTLFSIGSSTKAFGSTAVALLVEDGKLKWDDRVVDYLPWFRLPDPWITHELRVKDLLTMRAGTPSLNQLREIAKDRTDFLRRLRFSEQVHGFRDQYGYTNDMLITSGALVEAVAGKTWDEFMRERIWDPLGMKSTTSRMARARAEPNHMAPHAFKERFVGHAKTPGPQLRPIAWEYSDDVAVPAGGVVSSARDMAEWIRFQLDVDGRGLLSPKMKRLLHAPETVIANLDWWMTAENYATYAMGWVTGEFLGRTVVSHGGEGPGFNAQVAMFPGEGFGLFIVANRNSLLPYLLTKYIMAAYFGGAEKRDWAAPYVKQIETWNTAIKQAEAARQAGRLKNVGPSLPLARYAGTYVNDLTGRLQIQATDSGLVAEIAARERPIRMPLEHWQIDQFTATRNEWGVLLYYTFDINASGAVTGVTVSAFGTFKRVGSRE